jgi:DNA-binding transcriptional regulator YiaG
MGKIDIKALREGLAWTQEQMADYLGLDRSTVSRMENGQEPKGPTKKLLESLIPNGASERAAPTTKEQPHDH